MRFCRRRLLYCCCLIRLGLLGRPAAGAGATFAVFGFFCYSLPRFFCHMISISGVCTHAPQPGDTFLNRRMGAKKSGQTALFERIGEE